MSNNITLTLEEAKNLLKSNNSLFIDIALRAYDVSSLISWQEALNILGISQSKDISIIGTIKRIIPDDEIAEKVITEYENAVFNKAIRKYVPR